ncbi:diacylglycerol/lipid kinase family protein [Curtobacterium aurantiacum]|uniref:diacylglycerol/lipid kinase family protein n=1 Tax=Curtobacterium aurantiacum TaxID=3236919 RepID=UPI001BDE796A|nr:diacylglycerol kinase family protein [Curtobacterium flaccumfaciens]MBT1680225.1 NAD(+)/NADH kinase [Curtobacterium flaccumfaciens pv. flaccumfaciens]
MLTPPNEPGQLRAAVVVNPTKIDQARLRAVLGAEERAHGWAESLWFETSADDDGRAAARAARDSSPAVVLVAGGDGTLRVVAEELRGTGTPVALVPSGTGNLFARNLGLPLGDLVRSVRAGFTGTDRPIDVGLADLTDASGATTSHAFLVMTGIGLDASMAADTNAWVKKRFGWVAYSDPIARSIIGNRQIPVHYRIDQGALRDMSAHTIIVGNCGTLTAGVLLLPAAEPDDGLLDAVAFRPAGWFGWTKVGYALTLNRFYSRTGFGRLLARVLPTSRALRYTRARTLHLTVDTPERVQLDGDAFGEVTAVTLTTDHHGLTLRTPSDGRERRVRHEGRSRRGRRDRPGQRPGVVS